MRLGVTFVLCVSAGVLVAAQTSRPVPQGTARTAPRIKKLCDAPTKLAGTDPVALAPTDCTPSVSPGVQVLLTRAETDRQAGRTDAAKQDVADALDQARREDSGTHLDQKPPEPPPSAPCPVDNSVYVKLSQATKAADALAVAAEAQKVGDEAAGTRATATATQAYREWAEQSMCTEATTVGDYVTLARGAQLFGLEDLAATALDNAREVARANLHRAGVGEGGGCALGDDQKTCRHRGRALARCE